MADQKTIEELLSRLKSADGEERFSILVKLSKVYMSTSFEKALEYSLIGYEMIDEVDNADLQAVTHSNLLTSMIQCGRVKDVDVHIPIAKAFIKANKNNKSNNKIEYAIGLSLIFRNDYVKALNIFKRLDEDNKDSDNVHFMGVVLITLGLCYHYLTKYDSALECYYRTLKIGINTDNQEFIVSTHINIGLTLGKLKDRQNAIEHHKIALKIAEAEDNQVQISTCYTNIGTCYYFEKKYAASLEMFKKALRLSEKTNSSKNRVNSIVNIGRAYFEMGNHDLAKKYYNEGLELSEEFGFIYTIASICSNFADFYINTGAFDNADRMYKQSIDNYSKINSNNETSIMLGEYAKFLSKRRKYKHAFECLQDKAEVDDKINMETQHKTIADLNTKYEIERKEKEAELISQKNVELELESKEREKVIHQLEAALSNIKVLSGLVPICSHCKNIRDDRGYWNQIETYISEHSDATFSHGICPGCMEIHYPKYSKI